MDRHDLNRMFDGLAPGPNREQELLEELLQDGTRRKRSMKNWKRVVLAVAAAALLVTGAAAAVVPGISQRLLEYLGIAPEDTTAVDLLIPGAAAVDITKEIDGVTLHVSQVLRNRATIMVMMELDAPEGVSLYEPDKSTAMSFRNGSGYAPCFKNEAGEKITAEGVGSLGACQVLEDAVPRENHVTMLYTMFSEREEQALEALGEAATLWIPAVNVGYVNFESGEQVIAFAGDWSFEVPVPQKDTGWTQQIDREIGELDGASIIAESLYLSPLSFEITLRREGGDELSWDTEEGMAAYMRWLNLVNLEGMTLTTKDGRTVPLTYSAGGVIGNPVQTQCLRLVDITAPAEFQDGTLALDWACGKTVISLDDLKPVESTALSAE